MDVETPLFQEAIGRILAEVMEGPPGTEGFLLNPGDRGLVGTLDGIDERLASRRTRDGRASIAAHVDHVVYGFSLLNRWAAGEPNPWATADWEASWQRNTVTAEEWHALRDRLRREAMAWRTAMATGKFAWDSVTAAGAVSSAAHAAYHMAAIRHRVYQVRDEG